MKFKKQIIVNSEDATYNNFLLDSALLFISKIQWPQCVENSPTCRIVANVAFGRNKDSINEFTRSLCELCCPTLLPSSSHMSFNSLSFPIELRIKKANHILKWRQINVNRRWSWSCSVVDLATIRLDSSIFVTPLPFSPLATYPHQTLLIPTLCLSN